MTNVISLFDKDIEKSSNGDERALLRLLHRSRIDIKNNNLVSSAGLKERLRKRKENLSQ